MVVDRNATAGIASEDVCRAHKFLKEVERPQRRIQRNQAHQHYASDDCSIEQCAEL
jgi:hypothetical protein